MSNSTTNLDLISVSQAQKEVSANALFDAASPATAYGRRAQTSGGLVWGYYGGAVMASGVPTQIANGTLSLAASATNYIEADSGTGAVSSNTAGFTAGRTRLYAVVTNAAGVDSYTDQRIGVLIAGAGVTSVNGHTGDVTLAAADVGADASGAASSAISGHVAAGDPHVQYQLDSEKGAANGYASLGSDGKVPAAQLPASATTGGTVTSVGLSAPGLLYDVTGSPITGAGTLALALKTQVKNTFFAGPVSGADAAPTMRALTAADLPAQPFDVTAFYPGVPGASAIVTRVPVARAVTFPAGLTGSIAKSRVAAAAQKVFDVQKNGTSVGSITFAAAATSATFTAASAITLAAGDVLAIIAPATADTTLADVGIVLAGVR
jgi:hypothetical protein